MSGGCDSPVSRLLGTSLSRMPGSVVEQLLAMRAGLLRFNAPIGLRTALLYSGGWFVQWHEGPPAAVDKAWTASRSHPGHAHPRLIHRSLGPATLAEPVHISTLHSQEKPADVARRFHEMERQLALGGQAEPAHIWQSLSAPCLAGSGAALPRLRLVAVASELGESTELIKTLAERCRAEVNYQRFAGSDVRNADVGAAYVDVGCSGRLTRVHSLSRHALANGMVRMSLQHTQCVALLLGQRARAAALLAEAVSPVIVAMTAPASVRLIGPSPDTCDLAAETLKRNGVDAHLVAAVRGASHLDAVLGLIALSPTHPRPQ